MMQAMENAMEQMDKDLTAVTEEDIYKAAWDAYLLKWSKETDHLEEMPESEICRERAKIAWQRLMNLEAMMSEKGYRH